MSSQHQDIDKGPSWWKSMRFRIAMVGFFGGANIFIQRSNLSIAIVCMVNHTALDLLKHAQEERLLDFNNTLYVSNNFLYSSNRSYDVVKNTTDNNLFIQRSCNDINVSEKSKGEDGEFVWSKEIQGLLLGALYWGYIPLQVLGGYMLKRYGIRRAVCPVLLIMTVLTCMTHPIALLSPWAVFVLRILLGTTNAVCMPGIFFILTTWAPPSEKSRLSSLLFAGSMFGNIVTYPVSGLLCSYGFAGGWPSIFYVSGMFSFVCCVLWYLWVYDSPGKHPSIHPKEKAYIISSMNLSDVISEKESSIPWCYILKSMPVYAIVVAHTSLNWTLYLMLSNLPLYMREVLKFNATSNGIYTMLPYISMMVLTLISGVVFDNVTARCGINISRKLSVILGLVLPAVLLIITSYLDCEKTALVIFLLCSTIALLSLNFTGLMVNFFDIAPNYGGPIMTFSNTIANIPGILAPYTVAEFTQDNTREQWQKVFFLTSGILTFGALMFVIFGRVTVQKWALPPPQEESKALNTL